MSYEVVILHQASTRFQKYNPEQSTTLTVKDQLH